MRELSDDQILRQDFVDNAIYQLIESVNPSDSAINWDIEIIEEIRNIIREFLVYKMAVTDPQKFYPFND